MATAAALREIEDDCPWLREDFQAGLASLGQSCAEEARRYAADVRVLAELAAQVPRCPMDERGATPWTSFRAEVAVVRKTSDRGAAALIRQAQALTDRMPASLALLTEGRLTVQRARAFVTELEGAQDDVARLVDAQLAEKVVLLSVSRIVQVTRKALQTADPDEAARRVAEQNDSRDVQFRPEPDDQTIVTIFGPAVPLTRWYVTLDQRARALKAAGDVRTLAQLRFDLATSTFPCATHPPADPTQDASPAAEQAAAAVITAARSQEDGREDDSPAASADAAVVSADAAAAASGLRSSFVEPASTDCRFSRPVQANITVPVETGLGLSNEPGWLDGYGWLSAPTCRLLLVDAELRRVCTQTGTGPLVDLAETDVRPPPTYEGLRHALVDLVVDEITLTDAAGRVEQQHDPSPGLRQLVELRDRYCDGPTGTTRRASACELDHDTPWPTGPTAAWNLTARATRTHQLKHHGWTPLRTPTSTFWFTPAGQVIETPRHLQPPPGIDHDDEQPAALPDAHDLAKTDLAQLQPFGSEDLRPWLTGLPPDQTQWTWLEDDEPLPF